MPSTSLRALQMLLRTLTNRSPRVDSEVVADVRQVAPEPDGDRPQVDAVLTLQSTHHRAAVLGAVRHGLSVSSAAVGSSPVRLEIIHADDSSVVIGSAAAAGSDFRGTLVVRDCAAGSIAEYAVDSWQESGGTIHGLEQMQHVRRAIVGAVRSIDPLALVNDPASRTRG